ncbi:MAG: M56 family metallopeptidase, partial [Acutalibacteraceae bacterium]|nr:M56 family metallopeptidase [Acutalibacteraceae bacterium]
ESVFSLVPSAETFPTEQFEFDQYEALNDSYDLDIVDNPNYSDEVQYRLPGDVDSNSLKFVFNYFGWLIGMGVMLVYTLISYLVVKFKVRISVPLKENIYLCDGIDTPFILGIFKPKIYIPSSIGENDAEFVIAHEKAHLKRKDHLWKPFGFLLLSIYWFNPVLWIAYILLCKDIELACDEKVIRDMGVEVKKDYSNALINCSVSRKTISACPLAFGETSVKSRIKSILNYKKPAFWVIIVAIILSAVLAVCFLTDPIDKSNIFDAKFETVRCHYDYVITEEKATKKTDHIFGINASGEVYKDYGNGEGEYIGKLQQSDFSVSDLNKLLRAQDERGLYLGRTSNSYEILSDNGQREYVFIEKKNGDAVIVNFFSDGKVMSVFTLENISSSYTDKNDDKLNDELGQFIDLCIAEHHTYEKDDCLFVEREVIGKKSFLNKTTVYLWVLAEGYSYSIENGITQEHGSSIPTVITVEKESEGFMSKGNGGYKLVEYWEPRDGSYYAKDIRNKYPWYMHIKVFGSQDYVDELSGGIERKVMDYYGIDYAAFESIDSYNENTFGKKLTLNDVITLSKKSYNLKWDDFEEFNYFETGSGLYIRAYNINEMFTLYIGGTDPEKDPWYFFLEANDASEAKIDIRDGNVEEFISAHEKNPVVRNLSAGWNTIPVGYNERTLSKMYEFCGIPKNTIKNSILSLPSILIDDKKELENFAQKMSSVMNFDKSYSDCASFNSISEAYDDQFFSDSSLIFVGVSAPTTAHRHTVEYISESEGILSIGISEIDPETGDSAKEGWLVAISVSKDAVSDISEINAQISSTQFPNQGTANASIVDFYEFKDSGLAINPNITLYDNGMFTFVFSPFSSYLGKGYYVLENNNLILHTDDGKYTYTFRTNSGYDELIFDAEKSSDMLWSSGMTDGCIFQ